MSATPRTTVTMPRSRFAQLEAIAAQRGLPNPAALIEQWITQSIAAGEIAPELPGFTCQRLGADFIVSIHGRVLPAIPSHKARLLAAVLSAAAGEDDPELSFKMTPGKPVAIDLGEHNLMIARAGRSVRFVARPKGGGDGVMSSVSYPFAVEMARQIRAEFAVA